MSRPAPARAAFATTLLVALAVACVKKPLGAIARPECPSPLGEIRDFCRSRFEHGLAKRPECPTYDAMVSDLLAEKRQEEACPYGFHEGECGPFKVIHEAGRFGGSDYYFDAAQRLLGAVHWSDLALPCDVRALDPDYHGPVRPGETSSTEIGVIPTCSGVWTQVHCVDTSPK